MKKSSLALLVSLFLTKEIFGRHHDSAVLFFHIRPTAGPASQLSFPSLEFPVSLWTGFSLTHLDPFISFRKGGGLAMLGLRRQLDFLVNYPSMTRPDSQPKTRFPLACSHPEPTEYTFRLNVHFRRHLQTSSVRSHAARPTVLLSYRTCRFPPNFSLRSRTKRVHGPSISPSS